MWNELEDRERRRFLKFLAAVPFAGVLGTPSWFEAWGGDSRAADRLLILIELKGGNDGLNTLVPYRDPLYARLRPRLALKGSEVLPISERFGVHTKLGRIKKLHDARELAFIQGVGYPSPNLSHFRSIDIWETASGSQQFLEEGWAVPYIDALARPGHATRALILGDSNPGPIRGTLSPHLVVQSLERLRESKSDSQVASRSGGPASLQHILRVERALVAGLSRIGRTRTDNPIRKIPKPQAVSRLARSAHDLLELLGDGHLAPIMKLTLAGFDTHVNQLSTHARLLEDLDGTFALLAQGLKALGLWDKTLVMTYSEFGRRVEENRNGGTDHGTAGLQVVMGGAVAGGMVFGGAPDLQSLDQGNLRYTVDFRSVYITLIRQWWRQELQGSLRGSGLSGLPFLKV